jgi:hypothetical protein
MIDVVYTGDIRHNQEFIKKNNQPFFDKLKEITEFKIHDFTNPNGEKDFTPCPFDRGGPDIAPIKYYDRKFQRRGQGGAVQVWQFMNAVELTENPFILKMRTDVWLTKDSIEVLIKEIKRVLNKEYEVAYFGSDWLDETIGVKHLTYVVKESEKLPPDLPTQDFIIMANRNGLKDFNETIDELKELSGGSLVRSGNRCFRYILKEVMTKAFRHVCQMYCVRQYYKDYPTTKQVCYDYLMSYVRNEHEEGKMKPALDWYRKNNWND